MASYHNIDKSAFHPGEYVGYGPEGVYRIRKIRRAHWRAECSKPKTAAFHGITGNTLRFISERIAAGAAAGWEV